LELSLSEKKSYFLHHFQDPELVWLRLKDGESEWGVGSKVWGDRFTLPIYIDLCSQQF
jgi:hypothetical protein